jgi:succinate dehydrogenase / fumarate reductase, cytochrome b subunit
MSWILDFYRSTIGKKAVMAVSGIILFLWITAHMFGNLKFYLGPEALNHYGEWLRGLGSPLLPETGALWLSRILLLVLIWLHIQAATQLTLRNWASSGDYGKREYIAADYASRTMRWGGVIIALFVIWHILDLTLGVVNPRPDFNQHEIYANVVASFSVWWMAAIYIVANVILGFHLYHGLWSMFQSLGWNHPKFNSWRRVFATVFAIVIALGNISIPIAVLAGFHQQ